MLLVTMTMTTRRPPDRCSGHKGLGTQGDTRDRATGQTETLTNSCGEGHILCAIG